MDTTVFTTIEDKRLIICYTLRFIESVYNNNTKVIIAGKITKGEQVHTSKALRQRGGVRVTRNAVDVINTVNHNVIF